MEVIAGTTADPWDFLEVFHPYSTFLLLQRNLSHNRLKSRSHFRKLFTKMYRQLQRTFDLRNAKLTFWQFHFVDIYVRRTNVLNNMENFSKNLQDECGAIWCYSYFHGLEKGQTFPFERHGNHLENFQNNWKYTNKKGKTLVSLFATSRLLKQRSFGTPVV